MIEIAIPAGIDNQLQGRVRCRLVVIVMHADVPPDFSKGLADRTTDASGGSGDEHGRSRSNGGLHGDELCEERCTKASGAQDSRQRSAACRCQDPYGTVKITFL